MTLRDEYVIALEAENDDLRERVRLLEQLCGVTFEAPPLLGLTKSEAIIFGMLLKLPLCKKSDLMHALYPVHDQDEAEIKIVDVFVCKLRPKLKPYGIKISTQWGEGYYFTKADKASATQLLSDCAA